MLLHPLLPPHTINGGDDKGTLAGVQDQTEGTEEDISLCFQAGC